MGGDTRERKGAPMAHELVEAMANMKEKEALQIVDDLLAKGEDPNKILDLSSEAMQVVGQRYQEGTYFLPELIMSGEMLRKIGEILKPLLAAQTGVTKKLGKVVLGTVTRRHPRHRQRHRGLHAGSQRLRSVRLRHRSARRSLRQGRPGTQTGSPGPLRLPQRGLRLHEVHHRAGGSRRAARTV